MWCIFLAASIPKQNLLSHFDYWFVFVCQPTGAKDCIAVLPFLFHGLYHYRRLWYRQQIHDKLFQYYFVILNWYLSNREGKKILRKFWKYFIKILWRNWKKLQKFWSYIEESLNDLLRNSVKMRKCLTCLKKIFKKLLEFFSFFLFLIIIVKKFLGGYLWTTSEKNYDFFSGNSG